MNQQDDLYKIPFVLYARKSTEAEDRQVLSIDSQIDELNKIIQDNALTIIESFKESHSAKAPGRPLFDQMIDFIQKGKARGIVVWHPDRLSRNSIDTGRLVFLLDTGALDAIVTPSQVFRNTPNDKFLFNLLCSQAKLENDNKGINVKRGLKKKADLGCYPGHAPAGYMNTPDKQKGFRDIVIDPERFPIIRKMWELMMTGAYSVTKVAEIANKEWGLRLKNGKPMARSTAYRMFEDTFYYGEYEFPKGSSNWYKGSHQPMVTYAEWQRVQKNIKRIDKPHPVLNIFDFTGLIRCGECGCLVTAERKKKVNKTDGKEHHYIYYHCTKRRGPCSQKCVRLNESNDERFNTYKPLENQIKELLENITIPQEFHDFMLDLIRDYNLNNSKVRTITLHNVNKAYKQCMETIDGLIDMRARKEIEEEDYTRRMAEARKEKARLEELLSDTKGKQDYWIEIANEAFTFSRYAKERFEKGTPQERRMILMRLGTNIILKDQKLSVTIDPPLLVIKNQHNEMSDKNSTLEPLKNAINKEKGTDFVGAFPTRLPIKNNSKLLKSFYQT